jgi:outer membrane protein assembly factor BamD|tara:strand:+ start:598 stop:1428 length:831 start_codon:yes stop_codon:yes gene_type:complete
MYHKILYIFLITFLCFSCSKKEIVIEKPSEQSKSFELYQDAVDAMNKGEFFYASKKFSEAELILPKLDYSAKASLMSSYCLYTINFYDEAIENLNRYVKKYPASKEISYAKYLIIISLYEQILDETKDITPLKTTKEKILTFIIEYPDTEYTLDLKFKLDLINNQLAAKELYVAKYYIQTKKWIPAINRLKTIVEEYEKTIFIEEALHRLVEIYYSLGLDEEAISAAAILGYNYNSSEWYERSYKVLNKNYKIVKKTDDKKRDGLLKRTIKDLLDR